MFLPLHKMLDFNLKIAPIDVPSHAEMTPTLRFTMFDLQFISSTIYLNSL
jgi:hypothetical protein